MVKALSKAMEFGFDLLKLYWGANFSQIYLKPKDHKQSYKGTKIPLSVTCSITHRCNLACIHCQSENSDIEPDLSPERYLHLIDEIADAGTSRIGFTGGEPLMRKDMGDILKRCHEKNLITSIVSNAWLVKHNIDKLKDLGVLFLSLDGDEEIHDKIRGPKNFAKFLEAVSFAKAQKIPVAALTTLSSMNASVVGKMVDIIDGLGIHWMIGIIQVGFMESSEQDISPTEVKRLMSEICKVKYLRTSTKYLKFAQQEKPVRKCLAGIGYCIIDPLGELYPCFPAQFDEDYEGISLQGKLFEEAFQELPLYRKTCDTCRLACHIENNYLYSFSLSSIMNSFKLMKPAAVGSLIFEGINQNFPAL